MYSPTYFYIVKITRSIFYLKLSMFGHMVKLGWPVQIFKIFLLCSLPSFNISEREPCTFLDL